jgi:hypothetical protein
MVKRTRKSQSWKPPKDEVLDIDTGEMKHIKHSYIDIDSGKEKFYKKQRTNKNKRTKTKK